MFGKLLMFVSVRNVILSVLLVVCREYKYSMVFENMFKCITSFNNILILIPLKGRYELNKVISMPFGGHYELNNVISIPSRGQYELDNVILMHIGALCDYELTVQILM